jgi:hypothetical protein
LGLILLHTAVCLQVYLQLKNGLTCRTKNEIINHPDRRMD